MPDKLLYPRREAAARLGLGLTKFDEEAAAGRLQTVRVGRLVMVPSANLDAYVELLQAEARATEPVVA